jgi:hypothetical protein
MKRLIAVLSTLLPVQAQQPGAFFVAQPTAQIDIRDAGALRRWCLGDFAGAGRRDLFLSTSGSRAYSLDVADHSYPAFLLKNNPDLTFSDRTSNAFLSPVLKFINPSQLNCRDFGGNHLTSVLIADGGLDPFINGKSSSGRSHSENRLGPARRWFDGRQQHICCVSSILPPQPSGGRH